MLHDNIVSRDISFVRAMELTKIRKFELWIEKKRKEKKKNEENVGIV